MTYTAIPNGDTDPDSPVTTGLINLLRDNPIAIANRDAGAPAIINLPRASMEDAASGSESAATDFATTTNGTTSFVKRKQFITPYGGVFDFAWDHRRTITSGQCESRIYRNGSGVGTLKTTTSTSFVGVTDSVSGWSAGDLVQLYHRTTDGGSVSEVRRLEVFENQARSFERVEI